MPSQQNVGYSSKSGVAEIVLRRPEKLNAFNDDMVRQLSAALGQFDRDAEARVAVLSGEGRAFSTGADVHERHLRPQSELDKFGGPQAPDARASDLFMRSTNWKPVVAAVHGYALGMALGLALEADILVADSDAQFQVTETGRGLAACRYWALLRFKSSVTVADELTYTGRYFSGAEAAEVGIATVATAGGNHLEKAREYAEEIAAHPPLGLRAIVRMRRWYLESVQREAYLHSDPLKLHLTRDFREASRAWAEKRSAGPFVGE